jgi:hypothetical protein
MVSQPPPTEAGLVSESLERTAVDSAPAEVEILSVIEMRMPDGVRLIGARVDGDSPPAKVRSDRGSTRPCA